MTLEEDMRAYLVDETTLVGDRIHPFGKRPQREATPAITYQIVSGPVDHYAHGGISDHEVSFQFDCWADDADVAMAVVAELRTALGGYRGTWGDHSIGSVFLTLVLDDYEPKTGLYRRLLQADIHYGTPAG